jgi:DNA gyrase subunit A
MGRTARGVRGMRLLDGAEVISLIIPQSLEIDADAEGGERGEAGDVDASGDDGQIYILTGSENGYGKRTRLEEFPLRGRGGQGVIAMQTSARNGAMVAAMQVCSSDEMMLITDRGTLVRTRVEEVSISSRNTQGVTLIRLGEAEALVKTVRIQELEGDDELDAEGEEGSEEAVENSADDAAEGGSAEPGDDSAADDSNTDNND